MRRAVEELAGLVEGLIAERAAERARADRAEAVIRDLRGEGTERHEYADALIVVAQIFAHQHGGESATTMTVRRAAGALRTADRRLAAAIRERDEARAAADRLEMERDGLRRSYERARREALEEAARVCDRIVDHITERLNADLDCPDVWARLASRRQALEMARDEILALATKEPTDGTR